MQNIRNFSIIAHIDHGKSTLADRFIQLCGGLSLREMEAQVLDSMDIERERGITIKAQSVSLDYGRQDGKTYMLNFIDTPGHVDFSYEVSRSLAACEGALLVVDAAQGVEAQSVANCYTAIEQGLEVLPVLNKIDLPSADPDSVCKEIEEIIGIDASSALRVSAKTGRRHRRIARADCRANSSAGGRAGGASAGIDYRFMVRQLRGCRLARARDERSSAQGQQDSDNVNRAQSHGGPGRGLYAKDEGPRLRWSAGEVGFVISTIKDIFGAPVGDTMTMESRAVCKGSAGIQAGSATSLCRHVPDKQR